MRFSYTFLLLFLLFNLPKQVKAGLDSFSELDWIDGWLIERNVDSKTKGTRCRASLSSTGVWFSERIRINPKNENELIIPLIHFPKQSKNKFPLETLRESLSRCKTDLIYIPIPD